jgi:hypothetical protein
MAWCTLIPYDDLDVLLRKPLPNEISTFFSDWGCWTAGVFGDDGGGGLGLLFRRRLIVRLRESAYFSGRNLLR